MKFRYASHTSDLARIEWFYTEIVGLSELGAFENHENYSGVFLGKPDMSWHLEFKSSNDKPSRDFDDNDSLVFYVESNEILETIIARVKAFEVKLEIPKNPYWREKGVMISDPDGTKVIFTLIS